MALSCHSNSRDKFSFSCDPQLVLTDSLIGFVYEQIQEPDFSIGQYLNLVPTTAQNAEPKPTQHDAKPKPVQVTVYEQIQTPDFDIGQYLTLAQTTDQNADSKPGQEMVSATQRNAEAKPAQVTVSTPQLVLTDSLMGFVYDQIQEPDFDIGRYLNLVPTADQSAEPKPSRHDAGPKPVQVTVYEQIRTPDFDIGQYLNLATTTDQNADSKPGQEMVSATQRNAEAKPAQVTVSTPQLVLTDSLMGFVYEQIRTPDFDIGQYLNLATTTDQNADSKPGQEMVSATQHNTEPKPAQIMVPTTQYISETKPAQVMVPMTQHIAEPKPAQVMVPITQHIAESKPAQVMVPTPQYNAEPKPAQVMVPTPQYNTEPKPAQVMVPTPQYNTEPKPAQVMAPMNQYNAEPKPALIMVPTTQYNAEPKPGQTMVPTPENNTETKPAQEPMFNSSHLIAPYMPSLYQDPYFMYAQNLCQANIQFTPDPLIQQYQQTYNNQFSTASLTNQVHLPYHNPGLPVRPCTGRVNGVMVPTFKSPTRQTILSRKRRNKIKEKTEQLANLIPGVKGKTTAEMLLAAHKYVNFLKAQVGILAMMDSEEAKEVPLPVEEYMRSLLGSTNMQKQLSDQGMCLVPKTLVMNLAKEMESNVAVSRDLNLFIESIKK